MGALRFREHCSLHHTVTFLAAAEKIVRAGSSGTESLNMKTLFVLFQLLVVSVIMLGPAFTIPKPYS